MFHMRQVKIGENVCALVLLISGLVTCSGVFGSPLTDAATNLDILSENIPSDYKINVSFVTKNVDLTMQTFKCHYKKAKWPTSRFFNHVKEVLGGAEKPMLEEEFRSCKPPRCRKPASPPIPGKSRQQNGINGAVHGLLAVLIIPSMALLVLIVKLVFRRRGCCVQRTHEQVELNLNELQGGADESTGPHGGAARGDSTTIQQDRACLDHLECADTEV